MAAAGNAAFVFFFIFDTFGAYRTNDELKFLGTGNIL